MQTPKFRNLNKTKFHQELKRRVDQYFTENNIAPTGNFSLYFKAGLLWAAYIALYTHLVFFTPVTWVAVVECVLMGIATASIGFNVMHDGGHGSFSNSKLWNYLAAYSVNGLGASMIMWMNKHNIIHHTYTNIEGVDDDIEIKPFLRMAPTQKHYAIHRYQYIYFWLLYALLLFFWVFMMDFQKYFTRKVGNIPIKKMSWFDHLGFWLAKLFYGFTMIFVPIWVCGWMNWLVGLCILYAVAGLVLSVVFQLAHTVEETAYPVPNESNDMESEWAVHQIQTTANFATHNKVVSWFVGGLNFQIEHHLFPKISHVHYPAISKIIRQTCEEFNIHYIEFKRTRDAIVSHIQHLKRMGMSQMEVQ
jgi:linoleoyl-CoA desaturase